MFFLHPLLYLDGLGIIRNALAFSFVLLAIYYVLKDRIPLSIVLIVIAILFHKSAAIAFLIYPVYYIKNYRLLHISFFLLSFIISTIVSRYIVQYASAFSLIANAEHYIVDKNTSGGGTMTIIMNTMAIVHFLLWNRLSAIDKKYQFLLGLFNVGVCVWNVFLPLDSTIASRLGIFFVQVMLFLVPAYSLAVRRKYALLVRQLSICFFVVLFISYFYINVSGYKKDPSSRMSSIPYQTIIYHKDYSNYIVY